MMQRKWHWPVLWLCAFSIALTGCDDTLIQTDLHTTDDQMISLEVVRQANSTLPTSVDRVRLRVTGGAVPEVVDIALPGPDETREITVPVPSGTYAVSLVVYSDQYDEAYAFADTTGVEVSANTAATVSLDLANVTAAPDYLLGQELQVTPTTGDLRLDAFFSTPDLHPSLPNATLHYAPTAFGVPEEATHSAALSPELDSYYVANLTDLSDPAYSDSAYFRVETPLTSAWGDSLRAIAPSVAAGEAPHATALDGSIIVTFLRWAQP